MRHSGTTTSHSQLPETILHLEKTHRDVDKQYNNKMIYILASVTCGHCWIRGRPGLRRSVMSSSESDSNHQIDFAAPQLWLLHVLLWAAPRLHAASSFPSSWLWWGEKEGGGGLPCQHPLLLAERIDGSGRESYITIIFFGAERGWRCRRRRRRRGPFRCLDACRLAACCVKLIPLHLTARPSEFMWHWEEESVCGGGGEWETHLYISALTDSSCSVLWSYSSEWYIYTYKYIYI